MRLRVALFAFLTIVSIHVGWASIGPVTARADANAEARVFFEEGNRHLERAMNARGAARTRALEEALEAYASSLRIVRSRNAVFNNAIALKELGRFEAAFTYFTEYLQMEGLGQTEIEEAKRRRDELRDKVAVIEITSEPSGAILRLDRPDLAPRGRTPIEVATDNGEHTLYLSAEGYEPKQMKVQAFTGQRVEAKATLDPTPIPLNVVAPAGGRLFIDGQPVTPGRGLRVLPGRRVLRLEMPNAAPVERMVMVEPGSEPLTVSIDPQVTEMGDGAVQVESNVPAQVSIGGTLVGEGPRIYVNAPAGDRVVRVAARGYVPFERRISIRPNRTTTLQVNLVKEVPRASSAAPTILTICAVGSAAIAAGLSFNAVSTNDDFESINRNIGSLEQLEQAKDAREDVKTANLMADVAWGLTAALGAMALVLWISHADSDQPESTASVAVAPVEGGAMVGATFHVGAL